jgi:hypothetical protein
MISRATIFSPCRKYRYTLWRQWADDLFANRTKPGFVMFIGLNPSTADETLDDPTIRRCMDFTKRWGYLQMCMTNLFAWRDTSPRAMKLVPTPIGADNQQHLIECAREAALVICAWGLDGKHMRQDANTTEILTGAGKRLHHLGLNDDGTPKHPLYLKANTMPQPFSCG